MAATQAAPARRTVGHPRSLPSWAFRRTAALASMALGAATSCSRPTCADYHDPTCWSPAPPRDGSADGDGAGEHDAIDEGFDAGETTQAFDAAEATEGADEPETFDAGDAPAAMNAIDAPSMLEATPPLSNADGASPE